MTLEIPMSNTSHITGISKLFDELVANRSGSLNLDSFLDQAVQTIAQALSVDRCTVLLFDQENQDLTIKAQYCQSDFKPLTVKHYQLRLNCEWYALLIHGKPVPATDIQFEQSDDGLLDEFDSYKYDSDSKSLIVVPLVINNQLLGCLCLHHCREALHLSEAELEAAETFAKQIILVLQQFQLVSQHSWDRRVFSDCQLPLMLLDKISLRILKANQAALDLFGITGDDIESMSLLKLFLDKDCQRLHQAALSLDNQATPTCLTGLMAHKTAINSQLMSALLSNYCEPGPASVLICLVPDLWCQASTLPHGRETLATKEELVTSLSKQLNWERVARQIVCKLHGSRDRDMVLQATADCLGRVLGASRCLIVRIDGPAAPLVTHEYAEADHFPLGLGRTSQLPATVIDCFKQKTTAIGELPGQLVPDELRKGDFDQLLEHGIVSMLGTPVAYHGEHHGVLIILLSDSARLWSSPEIELLETVAEQAAIALKHADTYAQLKDHLFKMNVIGNLTQQLTNTLELASRATKQLGKEDRQSDPPSSLSQRELEVLRLIALGLANREIAQRLFLTESTVELHASRIRKKLKLKSRTALVKFACDHNLV
jgi:GAF domain-containing protein